MIAEQKNMAFQGTTSLESVDAEIFNSIDKELSRQQDQIELIASENIVSKAVLEAQGSVLTNKYAEGYPGRRYYGGCEYVDEAENLARERAKALFGCGYVNVQPHSGSQANQAVFMALLSPGDTFLGMSLDAGGHLTHGCRVNQSGKWFNAVSYGVNESDGLINYDEVEAVALKEKPKVIVAGGSAYPRTIDFARFRAIADKVGAYLWVDMAHFAGLVAAGEFPTPFGHAHVVTTTTHKTLRGPRGGMVLTDDAEISKKINSAIFPGLQGGPLMHVIAAKAVAFKEALQPEFKHYIQQVVSNSKILGDVLMQRGYGCVTGGTDSHLVLIDLRPKNITGDVAERVLEAAGLTCNKNGVHNDPQPPQVTSGIRLGSPAMTTRGFGVAEAKQVAELIADVLDSLAKHGEKSDVLAQTVQETRQQVLSLCARFPIYTQ